MATYVLDAQLLQLFGQAGVKAHEVLRKAGLPDDLFARTTPAVSSEGYLALMQAIGDLTPAEGLAVELAIHDGVQQFSPPIFASYCARDGQRCIERLARYKPLIAPVRYRLEELGAETTLYIDSDSPGLTLGAFVSEGEIAFILHVLRSATKTHVVPTQVEVAHEPSRRLLDHLGVPVARSGVNAITFRGSDLRLPFITANDSMWSFFEPELQRRLSQLEVDDTTSARVRAALVELLPAGETTVEDVARKLMTSARTLQRQLTAENTTFRKQLNHVRLLLAKQYLSTTDMTMDSIAFMLGYLEAASFVRAFTLWTGATPAQFRANHPQ